MLLSLISVLVLLVIAFYALWVAATGRVSGNEGPELSLGGRLVVVAVALLAFGVAYAVYRHHPDLPAEAVEPVAAVLTPATPSNPPDSRGTPVAEAVAPADDSTSKKAAPVMDAGEEPGEAAAVGEEPATKAAAAPVVAIAKEGVKDEEGLSAGAAMLEAQARQPRREAAARFVPEREPVVAAPSTKTAVSASTKVAAGRSSKASPRSSNRRRYSPLTLFVENDLGPDQLREQLTLSIEGKRVALIEVDDGRPAVDVAVPLPRPGLLHYRLEGVSEDQSRIRLMGEGCIRVRDGARFVVRRKEGSRKVFLETAPANS